MNPFVLFFCCHSQHRIQFHGRHWYVCVCVLVSAMFADCICTLYLRVTIFDAYDKNYCMVQNQTTNWKTERLWILKKGKKERNRITTDNTQKAKHVIRKDYPGVQSKTNTTLITSNQSQIMKLISLKGTGTPRLWVIALRLRNCSLRFYSSGSLRCFYLHYCQSMIRAFRSEANDCQEFSFYSFTVYLVAESCSRRGVWIVSG